MCEPTHHRTVPTAQRALQSEAFASRDGRIVLAGDAFGGAKIEGAFLSGMAVADQINRGD
jgi:predicted NAD/FAD-dependent oxidoreductase